MSTVSRKRTPLTRHLLGIHPRSRHSGDNFRYSNGMNELVFIRCPPQYLIGRTDGRMDGRTYIWGHSTHLETEDRKQCQDPEPGSVNGWWYEGDRTRYYISTCEIQSEIMRYHSQALTLSECAMTMTARPSEIASSSCDLSSAKDFLQL